MLAYFRKSRHLSSILATAIFWLSLQPLANATMIGTDLIVAEQQSVIERDALLTALDREDIKQVLVQKGVDPQQAKDRVASMTDEEVVALNNKIDDMPAASGAGGAILLILLILLITDLVGATDVYPFIDPVK